MNDEAVKWLREQVVARLEAANAATPGPWAWEATGEKDNSWAVGLVQNEDGETLSGEIEAGEGIVIDGVCEGIDGHLPDAKHIALNDPQDVIARCEAELAILDEFTSRDRDVDLMLGPSIARQREWEGLRLAVRLVASGYRHRKGYAQHWGGVNEANPPRV